MEQNKTKNSALSPMTAAEQKNFNSMMSEMQCHMNKIRMESIKMSQDAEKASSMSYLNC